MITDRLKYMVSKYTLYVPVVKRNIYIHNYSLDVDIVNSNRIMETFLAEIGYGTELQSRIKTVGLSMYDLGATSVETSFGECGVLALGEVFGLWKLLTPQSYGLIGDAADYLMEKVGIVAIDPDTWKDLMQGSELGYHRSNAITNLEE